VFFVASENIKLVACNTPTSEAPCELSQAYA